MGGEDGGSGHAAAKGEERVSARWRLDGRRQRRQRTSALDRRRRHGGRGRGGNKAEETREGGREGENNAKKAGRIE